MKAMVLNEIGGPLVLEQRPLPVAGPGQLLLKVRACAVCRTDLHLVDGELPDIPLPIIPGHEIVGEVVDAPPDSRWQTGDRVGVPWLGHTCGHCRFCSNDQENLCDDARFTGYQIDGGFAEFTVADEAFCFRLDPSYEDVQAAPLLCAGLIGYRSLRMCGDAERLGLYGFGAAAHIICQVARWQGREVHAFTSPGDIEAQQFALQLGAASAGDSDRPSLVELDAAIIFAPVGPLVPIALSAVRKGGVVVCGGIYMSDIPAWPYALLWGERTLRSVANLTRRDAEEFLALAPKVPVQTHVTTCELEDANTALDDLRQGRLSGAAVLTMGTPDREHDSPPAPGNHSR